MWHVTGDGRKQLYYRRSFFVHSLTLLIALFLFLGVLFDRVLQKVKLLVLHHRFLQVRRADLARPLPPALLHRPAHQADQKQLQGLAHDDGRRLGHLADVLVRLHQLLDPRRREVCLDVLVL